MSTEGLNGKGRRKETGPDPIDLIDGGGVKYTVILDGIAEEIETIESFAIKFSLLTREPVSKIKHLTKNVPAVIWSGDRKARGVSILSLIAEAGGIGRLETGKESPRPQGRKNSDVKEQGDTICKQCGFPLKKDDDYCRFCLTPVEEISRKKGERVKSEKKKPSIPPARLVIYIGIVIIALLLALVIS